MKKLTKITILLTLFAFLLVSFFYIHPADKFNTNGMDDYFIQNAQNQTGSNSVVAAVVFDYRGLDTLGEASVLFAAASGVFILFSGANDKKENEKEK
jgi:multisubunit Na+/H+ antiporter MnhB subunit